MAEPDKQVKPIDSPMPPKTMLQAMMENGLKEVESKATLATEADQQSSKILPNGDIQEESKDKDLNGELDVVDVAQISIDAET